MASSKVERQNQKAETLLGRLGGPSIDWPEYRKKIPKDDFDRFNEWLGLPEKDGKEFQIFSYQHNLRDDIIKGRNKHIVINKFAGAGATEIIPRIELEMMTTLDLPFRQFAIVTGTRMNFTEQVIRNRIRPIITRNHPELIARTTSDTIELANGYYFKGYPTDHIDAIRGQDDLQFIFIDEAAFFHPNMQEDLRMAIERYDTKTQPFIVWVSTPNGPDGTFYQIFTDALSSRNDYKCYIWNYQLGLECRLLTKEEVDKKQKENPRLWRQELNNEFIAPLGAVLPPIDDLVTSERSALRL
ncbi:MAG: terminase family protein [Nitrosopumilaceae archaeon]